MGCKNVTCPTDLFEIAAFCCEYVAEFGCEFRQRRVYQQQMRHVQLQIESMNPIARGSVRPWKQDLILTSEEWIFGPFPITLQEWVSQSNSSGKIPCRLFLGQTLLEPVSYLPPWIFWITVVIWMTFAFFTPISNGKYSPASAVLPCCDEVYQAMKKCYRTCDQKRQYRKLSDCELF